MHFINESLRQSIGIMLIIYIAVTSSCKKEQVLQVPEVTTNQISDINGISAIGGGQIISQGTGNVVVKGVCWSTGAIPTVSDNKTRDGEGAGTFTSTLTILNGATTYYVRAYAKNSAGIGYGNIISFTTLGSKPMTSVLEATNITINAATLNGKVNPNDLPTLIKFEYGTTTQYGKKVNGIPVSVSGNMDYIVGADIARLFPATLYHFRTQAENSLGIVYSEDRSFTTFGEAPTVLSLPPTSIMSKSVRLEANVNANSILTAVTFEYGTTTNYGMQVSASEVDVYDDLAHKFTLDIKGLEPNTTYHYRVKAVNYVGSTNGNDISFTTNPVITDIEGNIYGIVTIGSQIWMQENLRTTSYNDNTPIPLVIGSAWDTLATPGFCYRYDVQIPYAEIYGAYYNWYAVNTAKICPVGWHIPNDEEWNVLFDYLGGSAYAARKMMVVSDVFWNPVYYLSHSPTNESGFSAIPGGGRFVKNDPFQQSGDAFWYSSSYLSSTLGSAISISYFPSINIYYAPKSWGLNIRCVKD